MDFFSVVDTHQEKNFANTDYGREMKPFFSLKSKTFGFGQTLWADKFWGIWGIFGRIISTYFGTVSSLSMFSINQPLFLKQKLSLYIQISNIYLGLGFEFGPQRIIILCGPNQESTIGCPQSVLANIPRLSGYKMHPICTTLLENSQDRIYF